MLLLGSDKAEWDAGMDAMLFMLRLSSCNVDHLIYLSVMSTLFPNKLTASRGWGCFETAEPQMAELHFLL